MVSKYGVTSDLRNSTKILEFMKNFRFEGKLIIFVNLISLIF